VKLDAGKAANQLYQQGALNQKEFEEIQRLSSDRRTRAAEQLLNLVLSQSDDFLECFLNSLMKTGQLHVHQWILLQGDESVHRPTVLQRNVLYRVSK